MKIHHLRQAQRIAEELTRMEGLLDFLKNSPAIELTMTGVNERITSVNLLNNYNLDRAEISAVVTNSLSELVRLKADEKKKQLKAYGVEV